MHVGAVGIVAFEIACFIDEYRKINRGFIQREILAVEWHSIDTKTAKLAEPFRNCVTR